MKSDSIFRSDADEPGKKHLRGVWTKITSCFAGNTAWIFWLILLTFSPPATTAAQNAYDLYLVSVPEESRISTIQAIARIIPGISPGEILDIFKTLPTPILEGASKLDCESGAKRLEQAGAKVQIIATQNSTQQIDLSNPVGNYSAVLLAVPEDQKVAAIRVIAEIIPGIRPLDVIAFLKSLPTPILNGVSKEEGEEAVKKLQAAGLRAEVRVIGSSNPKVASAPSTSVYDVNVVFFPATKRIPVIGVVKELKPGLGVEAIVEDLKKLPVTILHGVSKAEAETAVSKLEEAGATVETKAVASVSQAAPDLKTSGNKDVILTSVPADKKISVIRAIAEIKPSIGLEEAVELLKKLPVRILQGVTKAESDIAETILVTAGAKVEIKTLEQVVDPKMSKTVDVILVSVPKEKQIAVLNAITELNPTITLEEVVDLLKKLPVPLFKDLTKADGDVAAQLLMASGATVEVKDRGISTLPVASSQPSQASSIDKNKTVIKPKEKNTLPIKSLFPIVSELNRIQFGTPVNSVKKTLGDPTVEMSLQGKMSFTYKNKSIVVFCDEKGVCEMSVWFASDCGYLVTPYTKKAMGQFSKSSLRSDIMQVFGDPDDIQPYMGGKYQEFSYFYSHAVENVPVLTVKFIIAPNDLLSGIAVSNSR